MASHLVTLWNWGGGTLMQIGAHGVPSGDAAYVVPTGQSLVITSVEFYPSFPSNSPSYVSISPAGVDTFYANWVVQSNVTTSFQYPSGIVVASGTSLYFSSSVGGFGAYLRGYLTPN